MRPERRSRSGVDGGPKPPPPQNQRTLAERYPHKTARRRRYLFPPMLNTVKAPTASARGKSARTSAKCLHAARLVMLCQCSSGSNASECVLLNSVIAALLMILTA